MSKFIVSGLYIYPVKGLKGIALETAKCTDRGLENDRMWMIIDESNNFISQRTDNKMALIHTFIAQDGIKLTYQTSSITLPFQLTEGVKLSATVWDDTCTVICAAKSNNDWISDILGKKCQFVYMEPTHRRMVDPRYAKRNESVSFADGFPYLILGNESLNLLNSKLETPIKMDRFRPNIVFDGGEPHCEDLWRSFTIGKVDFYGEKPCARCKVTTIDQQTGIQGKEPLKTLSSYRQNGNKIMFGLNILSINDGFISIDDQITIKA